MNDESNTCPQCGTTIPDGAPEGMCPKCLLAGAAAPTEAGTIPDTCPRPTPPSIEEVSAAFPQFEIIELIGQGGMGFVFRARQTNLERDVALKILPQHLADDPKFAERFVREGKLLAKLNHPNIVSIFDVGESGGFFYLLMEYVDGVNLRQAMRASRFTAAQALSIVPKICEALQFAHEEGVLHRDIKPENILLDAKGRIKIADFGIAKMMETGRATLLSPSETPSNKNPATGVSPMQEPSDANLTVAGTSLGTPQYMAPEQIDSPTSVDHRADIYSLGVVFYELLTGELPSGEFKPPSSKTPVDAEVDEVVARALAKERENRQQSAAEFKTQVETLHPLTSRGKRAEHAASEPSESNPHDQDHAVFSSWQLPASITCVAFFALMTLGMLVSGIVSTLMNSTGAYALTLFLFIIMAPVIWVVSGKKLRNVAASGDSHSIHTTVSILTVIGVIGFLIFLPMAGFGLFFVLAVFSEIGGWNPNPAEAIFVPLTWLGTAFLPVCSYKLVTSRRLVASSKRNDTPALNPWPRRIFMLVIAIVCIPIGLVAIGILISFLSYRVAEAPATMVNQKFGDSLSRAVVTSTNTMKAYVGGGSIELLVAATHPDDGVWWRPDGAFIGETDFDTYGSTTGHRDGNREYELVFRTTDLPTGSSGLTLKMPRSGGWAGGSVRQSDGSNLADHRMFSVAIPEEVDVTDAQIGIAVDRWEEIHKHDGTGFSSVSFNLKDKNIVLSWTGTTRGVERGIVQSVSHNLDRSANQLRLVAILKDGSETTPGKSGQFGDTITAEFHDVEFEEVKGFRLESRPYTWINFPDVTLPKQGQAN